MTTGEIDPFADIPDPIRSGGARPPPEPRLPDEPSPTREQRGRKLALAALLATGWLVVFAAVLGFRPDLANVQVAVQLVAWTLALPLGLLVALGPRRSGWPAGVVAQRVALVALLAVFVGFAMFPPEGAQAPLSFQTVRGCLSATFLLALPPLVLAALVLRGSFLNAPALRGGVVGAVCGMAGAAAIHSHCSVVTSSHVFLAHGLPLLVLGAIGALFGLLRGRA